MNRSSWTRLATAVLICMLGYSACTGGGPPQRTNTTEAAPVPTAAPSGTATPVPRPSAAMPTSPSPTSAPDAGEEEPRTPTTTAQAQQPTATPTSAATSSAPTERIAFLPGATTFSLTGHLPANGDKLYVMNVAVGQYMEIDVATEGDVGLRLSLTGADGTVIQWLGPPHLKAVAPSTQDYTLRIASAVEPVDYALSVLIPVRIVFAPGTTQATVTGVLTGDEMRSYVLRASAGQTLSVETTVTQGAVKTVIAGSDGAVLVSGNVATGPVLGPLTLNTTQDYLITVLDVSGEGAQYEMTVRIPAATTPSTSLPSGVPRITSFTAQVTGGAAGESIELKWEADGERVMLCPIVGAHWAGCACLFDVPLAGMQTVGPDEIVGHTTGFELVVDGAGERVTETVDLDVACPVATPAWFFDAPPPMCPRAPALRTPAAAQRFERGAMIWLAEEDTYYLLYDDYLLPSLDLLPSTSGGSLQIVRGPLDLEPGADPNHRTGETPPPGRVEPVSGFGLIWRGEVQGVEGVRARLGWAVEEEAGFEGAVQCEVPCGAHLHCYLRDPQGAIVHLSYERPLGYMWAPWPTGQ